MPTHKELANRIGTHREAVTKELKSLVHEGIAEAARGALRIKDVAKLTKMVKGPEGEDYQNIGR
jgi:predicted ArsR family transcriptional regulator